ncbi:FHA domain protein [Nocardioides dokdonensis FR1436]|uniref:FHA domain protein n=1 Tax=Nocardioides dokdonensis FR1436 TaxID=1300347 RepID=A0A1A9GGP4_9ACTN|nr:FHA domain-containing protein [Nocardioides dokdonensis]ANH36812.1 FHA domain protein [Nocardioides dokdonensis FR1436]
MRLRLSLVVGGTSIDVLLEAAPTTPAVELEAALRRLARVPLGPLLLDHPLRPVAGAPVDTWEPVATIADLGLLEGSRVVLGEHGVAPAVPPAPIMQPQPDREPLELHVVSGPDSGVVLVLPMGVHELGRSGARSWHDHSLSRRHCRVVVTPVSVAVTDLGSSNGTRLDGEPCPPHKSRSWSPGQVLAIGDSLVELRPAAATAVVRPVDGRVTWRRPDPAPRDAEPRPGRWPRRPARRLRGAVPGTAHDPALVGVTAGTLGRHLWARRDDPDALALRLGTTGATGQPVVQPLTGTGRPGVLGLAGPEQPVDAALRWWMLQLCVRHAPDDLEVAVLGPRAGPDWSWLRWLPHLRDAPGLLTAAGERPHRVLVLHGYADLTSPDDPADLVRRAAAAGVVVLATGEDVRSLPVACGAVVRVDEGQPSYASVTRTDGQGGSRVRLEGVGASWSDQVARSLAPLVPAGPGPTTDPTAGPPAGPPDGALRVQPLRWTGLPDSPPSSSRV